MSAIIDILSPNKGFYPTPEVLADRMIAKIKGANLNVLEPSAGKADLADRINKKVWSEEYNCDIGTTTAKKISCIEIDPNLQHILRGKKYTVIDSDFLTFAGPDKFDLIIGNPPFRDGHQHLLKAIDILFSGQIIFLLNAETIKNPYSNSRKLLVKKLKELNADIEYIENAFITSERPTGVEVVLIDITIDQEVETNLFDGAGDRTNDFEDDFQENHQVSTGKTIKELVADYNDVLSKSMETILTYYKNYRKISKFVSLNEQQNSTRLLSGVRDETDKLTNLMQDTVNDTASRIRASYWLKTLSLDEVKNRLTEKKQDEFDQALKEYSDMDFTENNIRTFIINLIGSYDQTIVESITWLFNKMTNFAYRENNLYLDNVHLFDGWKTNSAFKVGKKVILPVTEGYGNPWRGSDGHGCTCWTLDCKAGRFLKDIDLVMNYFDGGNPNYVSISAALKEAFLSDETRGIESTYFKISVYKKGTIHLTFLDKDILRRFNVVACKEKDWLPDDYNETAYEDMSQEAQEVVHAFEGVKSYKRNYLKPLITAESMSDQLRLAA